MACQAAQKPGFWTLAGGPAAEKTDNITAWLAVYAQD